MFTDYLTMASPTNSFPEASAAIPLKIWGRFYESVSAEIYG
jgi:hypothetical protein